MLITTATHLASNDAQQALRIGHPILHLVTDDFSLVLRVMDQSFYGISDPDGASMRYTSLSAVLSAAKADKKNAAKNWQELISGKTVIYASTDADGELSDSLLQYVADYQEQHHFNRHCFGTPLASRMVIYGKALSLPATLEAQVARIEFPELSADDYKKLMLQLYQPSKETQRATDFQHQLTQMANWFANQLAGFPENEVRTILQTLLSTTDRQLQLNRLFDKSLAEKIIRREKNKKLNVHGKLDCVSAENRVVGLKPVVNWLKDHKENIIRDTFENEEDITKGILLLGLPGTGKSLLAKSCAAILELPLIRLDISRLLGRYVGDSEKNMDQVLQDLTEAGAPCVLWIDELDKAYSGVGSDSGGSSVMNRLFGKMLTFMQEMRRTVFMVATANDITAIPPELFRAGRFSQIFSLMLPSFLECKDILRSKLARHLGEREDIHALSENLMYLCSGLQKWNGEELVDRADSEPVRFLTGADISLLAQEMAIELELLPGEASGSSIKADCIYGAMQKVMDRCRTTVDTGIPHTLELAAECYHRVLEQGAISANDASAPICKENYQPGKVTKAPSDNTPQCLKKPEEFASPYDEEMFRHIGMAIDHCIRKTI